MIPRGNHYPRRTIEYLLKSAISHFGHSSPGARIIKFPHVLETSTMRFSIAALLGVLTILAVCFSIWRRDAVIALVFLCAVTSIWRVTRLALSEKMTLIRAAVHGGASALVALIMVVFVPMLVYVGYQQLAGTWSTNYPETSAIRILAAFIVLYGGGSIIVGMAAGVATHVTIAMSGGLRGALTESQLLGEISDDTGALQRAVLAPFARSALQSAAGQTVSLHRLRPESATLARTNE